MSLVLHFVVTRIRRISCAFTLVRRRSLFRFQREAWHSSGMRIFCERIGPIQSFLVAISAEIQHERNPKLLQLHHAHINLISYISTTQRIYLTLRCLPHRWVEGSLFLLLLAYERGYTRRSHRLIEFLLGWPIGANVWQYQSYELKRNTSSHWK